MTTSDDAPHDTGAAEDPSDSTAGSYDTTNPGDDMSGDDSGTDDPGSPDPGSPDPGSPDPGSDDPSAAGSGDTGSADADSGSTDSGDSGSGDADSGSTDSGDSGSSDADSGGTSSGDTGSGDTGSGDVDSGDSDSDPASSEAGDGATANGGDAGTTLPVGETDDAGNDADAGTSAGTAPMEPVDLGAPYLIVDQYSGDSGMNPPWATLVGLPHYYGAILKAWEGAAFNDGGWFAHNWPAVRQASADRYGSSWFRGAYLFLKFDVGGAAQADAYLAAVDAAGGWGSGDILPVVDVELGGPTNANHSASKQQVIDCVSACTARLKEQTSRRVMLYGRGAMRDLQIADKMGADVAWNPSYTPTMHQAGLEGFALEDIVLWQYCGDNVSYLPNYPHQVSGFAKLDISVFIKGSAEPTLDDVRTGLLS